MLIEMVVREAIEMEFRAYHNIPDFEPKSIESHYHKGGSAFKEIVANVMEHQSNKECIQNAYNPSSYDILDLEVKEVAETKALVESEQYWLLCWYDVDQKKYVRRYKNISTHKYLLEKSNGQWKIKTNATVADKMVG